MHATWIHAGMPTHYIALSFATGVCFCESTYLAGRAEMPAPGPRRVQGYRYRGVGDRLFA